MGAAPAWLSLLIMLLIGFILGGAAGILWSTRRRQRHTPLTDVEQLQPVEQQQPSWAAEHLDKKLAAPYSGIGERPFESRGPLGSSIALSSMSCNSSVALKIRYMILCR